MQTTLEQVRARDYERFEANRRFEEMTDIAERLGYPIDTTIHYEMRGGVAYALSDTVDRPFHNQTWLALQRGKTDFVGDQAFEQERLRLEHEEALLVDAFGAGGRGGNVLVKISKIPDAIVRNETSIKGYRRDLLRSFVRFYIKTDSGVTCRLFTLDHNSPAGMKAVGELLGIDATARSERVLASHSLFEVPDAEDFVDELVERTKLVYDEMRHRETGERSYAGSVFIDKQNAMSEIEKQSYLVNQHMKAIADIVRIGRGELALEDARRSTAAAIKLASQGVRVESAGDASVTAEVRSGNYDRECATGAAAGMNQAQSLESVKNEWKYGECLVCFAKTMVGSCSVCASCEAADNAGVDLLKLQEENLRTMRQKQALAKASLRQPLSVAAAEGVRSYPAAVSYGQYIRVRQRITIGSAVQELYDWRTGEVVDER